ncbi:hypothetical protein [Meridianimarinicoccus roseus]|jgi:hypothetical protein|uniref:hypothetical protein n=1 Tax=Meridianimarinicoccus roseus TaxID=2072018 RepID=UPI001EE6442C|nr:hypothetical protein [Meridianimarinicoccus roseus]
MTAIITQIRTAARKRAEYNRTLAELQSMPLGTMIDFDLGPNDLPKLAHTAVYGQ